MLTGCNWENDGAGEKDEDKGYPCRNWLQLALKLTNTKFLESYNNGKDKIQWGTRIFRQISAKNGKI